MYSFELFEAGKPRVVVTYPGRFQPFHQGHAAVFAKLQKKFGADNVFILTSNDTSSAKSPFNFTDKYRLITAAGVPGDKIIETNNMYVLPEGFDPASTIFVTAVGEPDKQRLGVDTFTKKDKKDKDGNVIKPAGSPSYFKSFDTPEQKQTADQHGYVVVIPEVKKSIKIGGKAYDVSHGTECRNLWNLVRGNREQRAEFLTQLYGSTDPELARIFDKIPVVAAEDISPAAQDSTSPIHGGIKSIAESRVAEVAMNPSAFAQSIKQGQEKGVLVGFEFEVLIPEASINAASTDPNVPQYDPNSTAWLQGKSIADLLTRLQQPVTGKTWNYIIEDLFKIKSSIANDFPTKNVWSLYNDWANRKIHAAAEAAYPRWVSDKITKILKNREVANTPLMYQGEERNALFVFVSTVKGKTGIELTPGRSFNARGVTPEQLKGIEDAARELYYETSRPIDQLFRPLTNVMDSLKNNLNQEYFRRYDADEDISEPVEKFTRFCEEVFETTDLTELLRSYWAFNGRTNNSNAILKEKLWYYITPGAPKPESLRSTSGYRVDYDKGAQFLKKNLEGAFGTNMTIFSGYHQATKKLDRWYIEPDGSLRPNSGDTSAEVVSPPLPAVDAVNALKIFYQKAQEMHLYTNQSTGLHINVSIPDTLDVLKLAMFVGDQYVLKTFGRENNNYARSVIKSLQGNGNLPELSERNYPQLEKDVQRIAANISSDHFATVNFNGKYVSFRHAGGDYLNKMGDIVNTIGRFVRAMIIASDPNAYRNEYLSKLMKLVGGRESEQSTSGITPESLKKILITGIPAIQFDAALRPGFGDPNLLLVGALQNMFNNPEGKAVGFITPDPAARQRLLAAPGWGNLTKEYLQTTEDNVFFNIVVVPTSEHGFQTIERNVDHLSGNPDRALGLYDRRNNRVGVCIRHPSTLPKSDPRFAKIFQALKGKVVAGPRGVLPESSDIEEGFKHPKTYLWHGSRQKIPMLEPRQSIDTGGAAGSNKNAIYATNDPKIAIAMGLTTAGSDTGMFPNDPQMVLFKGAIRKGQNVYLHKVPMYGDDGKPQFVQGGNDREFHSVPGVTKIRPIEIVEVPVNKYLNLIRYATPQDLELRRKYMSGGVKEDAAGVGVVAKNKKMAKDPRYSMSITKDVKPETPKNMLRALRLAEDFSSKINPEDFKIKNFDKLDHILSKLCEMVEEGQKRNADMFGMVAACVLDPDNQFAFGINYYDDGSDKRVHAERAAMDRYNSEHGEIPEGSIIITTLSPCCHPMEDRYGDSCTEIINNSNVHKVYCGYKDPTQDGSERKTFHVMQTRNPEIVNKCKSFAKTFLGNVVKEDAGNIGISEKDMMDMIKKFLPLAMKELKIKKLPRITMQPHVETHDGQATFGRFVDAEEAIYLGIADRHPVDILRTLAHELVHFKQFIDGKMYHGAGETGSPIENEAHVKAGIIMRHFNKKYPNSIKSKDLKLTKND